jgi:hypothetical protein
MTFILSIHFSLPSPRTLQWKSLSKESLLKVVVPSIDNAAALKARKSRSPGIRRVASDTPVQEGDSSNFTKIEVTLFRRKGESLGDSMDVFFGYSIFVLHDF